LTQRKLTADEIGICRSFYAIGGHMRFLSDTYHLNMLLPQVADAIKWQTSDGKPPIQAERVPTAADIGRPVKVRNHLDDKWFSNRVLVGLAVGGDFLTECRGIRDNNVIGRWNYCIIDQEAGE
jgi:hypothetical protein